MSEFPSSQLATKKKKPSTLKSKRPRSSKSSSTSKDGGYNFNTSFLSPTIDWLSPKISVDGITLFKNETSTGLNEAQVERLVKGYSETSSQMVKDLNGRLDLLGEDQRRLVNQELGPRLVRLEEQLRMGASEEQIIAAHAQGANENMKGVLTGVACTILIGLLVVGGWYYASKKSSREAAAATANGDNSDDGWQNAAKASSVEKLDFAMAKLRKMKV